MPVAFVRIEHILPRSARPELVVTWANLTLACEKCNHHKGDYYAPAEPLLNPYAVGPEEHLVFAGPLVVHQPGSDMGYRTVQVLRLSRIDLIEARVDRLNAVINLLDRWRRENNPQTKEILADQIRAEAEPNRPYSATVRAYVLYVNFPFENIPAPAQ